MSRIRWTTFALLLPLYVGLLLTVGHYASQLEATYQPGVAAAGSTPLNYSQDRVSRLLPPAHAGVAAAVTAAPATTEAAVVVTLPPLAPDPIAPETAAPAPMKNTPATNHGAGPATVSAVDNGADNGAAASRRKKP